MLTPVTRDQFDVKGRTEVVHRPTGARLSTYEYEDPANAASTLTINWGQAGNVLPNGEDYDRDEIKQAAVILLRELAQ